VYDYKFNLWDTSNLLLIDFQYINSLMAILWYLFIKWNLCQYCIVTDIASSNVISVPWTCMLLYNYKMGVVSYTLKFKLIGIHNEIHSDIPTIPYDILNSILLHFNFIGWNYTIVWEKFIVENIHVKIIRCKNFLSLLASDEKFFTVKFFTIEIFPVQAGCHFTSFS